MIVGTFVRLGAASSERTVRTEESRARARFSAVPMLPGERSRVGPHRSDAPDDDSQIAVRRAAGASRTTAYRGADGKAREGQRHAQAEAPACLPKVSVSHMNNRRAQSVDTQRRGHEIYGEGRGSGGQARRLRGHDGGAKKENPDSRGVDGQDFPAIPILVTSRATQRLSRGLRVGFEEIEILGRFSAPGGIRTPDPWLRRPLLYPAELQAQKASAEYHAREWDTSRAARGWREPCGTSEPCEAGQR
jgi:hypothetical protein